MSAIGSDGDLRKADNTANGGAVTFVILALLLVGAATLNAIGFPGKAGLAPLTVGIPTTVLLAIIAIRELRHFKRASKRVDLRVNAYFWILVFVVAFYALGAIGALIVFSVGLLKIRGERTWKVTLIYTAVSATAFFLLTETVLGESLYRGLFMEQLR